MEYIKFKTHNIDIKITDNKIKDNKIYNFKINKYNKSKYTIVIISTKLQIIQFKLNSKLISKLLLSHNKLIIPVKYIPWSGLIVNYKIDIDNPLTIQIEPLDICSEINIWDFEILNIISDNFIKWDKIYIINLKRRIDRKQNMIKKMKKINVTNYEFIEAFDGKDENIKEEFMNLKNNNLCNIVTEGHYGCLLSHIKALEMAKKNNYNNIMIIEDDIFFIDNFLNKINNIILPNYDMVYLGGIIPQIKFGINGWIKTLGIMGAFGYIVNKCMYDIILQKLYKKNKYIDVMFLEDIQPNYNVFMLNDYIKTNLDTSDTSGKNRRLIRMLNNTNL